jgi:uncharacterized membrane protein required for colicin V production
MKMEFIPSWLNPFDVLILFALVGGVVWGFLRGLVRMALGLLVLYVAAVLAMTFYEPLGERIVYLSGHHLPVAAAELTAFLLILILTAIVLNFATGRAFKDTDLPGVRQIDQLGGMVLGFVLAVLWIGLILTGLGFALSTPGFGSDAFRGNWLGYMHSSLLVPIFFRFLPIAFATLKPWVPKGQLPGIFTLNPF